MSEIQSVIQLGYLVRLSQPYHYFAFACPHMSTQFGLHASRRDSPDENAHPKTLV